MCLSLSFCYETKSQAENVNMISVEILQQNFSTAKNNAAKIKSAFSIVEYYIENDFDDSAQTWIYTLIELNNNEPNDTINYFIQARLTEIFYFSNLAQFGLASANKGLAIARHINDSVLIADAWAFKGFVYEDLDSLDASKQATLNAFKFYPKLPTVYDRSLIKYSQIVNQLAQIYLKLNDVDSAYFYNVAAYKQAKLEKATRATNMCLSTFGNIFIAKNNTDSAMYYFELSNLGCTNNHNDDIKLWNRGRQLVIKKKNITVAKQLFKDALLAADGLKINSIYKKLFYKDALSVFTEHGDLKIISDLQKRLLLLNEEDNKYGNKLTQEISEKYVSSENNFLKLNLKELNTKRRLNRMQLISIISISLLAFGIGYFLYRKKRNKLLEIIAQQELVQLERNRIARDMHDDFGANLSRIKFLSEKLKLQSKDRMFLSNDLSKISNYSDEMSEKMNEIVWSLNQRYDTVGDLIAFCRSYAVETLTTYSIGVEFNKGDIPDQTVSGELRRVVFLILKEALHNIVKHSEAKVVKINFNTDGQMLAVNISDNGIGFDEQKVRRFANGLQSMRHRIAQVDGEFSIIVVNGTSVVYKVPFKKTR